MATLLVPSMAFDSETFPEQERFEHWRAIMAGLYDMTPSLDPDQGKFEVRSTGWHLGSIIVGDGHYGHQRVERSPTMVRRDQLDHYKIVVRDEGAYDLDADGSRVRIPERGVIVEDLARPERWISGGGFSYYVYIARDALDDLLPAPLSKHGEVLRTGTSRLLADHVRSLVRNLPEMTTDEVPDVVSATTRLIAACLAPSLRTVGEARPAMEVTLLRQMCRYVELHLEDSVLDAAAIGKAFRVSRSVLYRLFEPLGGVHSFIKERRLAKADSMLAVATAPMHLGRLADRLAFKSAAHFSREYKLRFGHAPSDSAEHGRGGSAGPADLGVSGLPFARWLQAARG